MSVCAHAHTHDTHHTCARMHSTHHTCTHACARTRAHTTHASHMHTHAQHTSHMCMHTQHTHHACTHTHAQGWSATLRGLRQGVRTVNVTQPSFTLCPCTGCRDDAIVGKIERGSLRAAVRGPGHLSSFSVQPLLTDHPP